MEIILWDFLRFYQIFFSPKVKHSAIISNKQGVYNLPHQLPKNLNAHGILAAGRAFLPTQE